MIQVAVALLFAALFGCATLDPGTTPAGDHERQLLVMITAAPPHYRPGTSASGYGSGATRPRFDLAGLALARDHGMTLADDWPMPALGLHCFVMTIAAGQSREMLAAQLAADPRVESVQPVQLFRTLARNDPYYAMQSSARALDLDGLHQIATGRNVRIAQVDTGVDLSHPDLLGALTTARNFVDGSSYAAEVHGTAVAGVMVARADNSLGIVGVAPDATLLPLRACWPDQADSDTALCSSFTLAKAIQFAVDQRVRVLNLSLGGPRDRLLERLIDRATDAGMTVVGAVDAAAPGPSFPSAHPRVIAIVAADEPRLAFYVELPRGAILAPGRDVLTTVPQGRWRFFSGASFAAAHATGVVALLLEKKPDLNGEAVRALLAQPDPRGEPTAGLRLDGAAALALLGARPDCGAGAVRPVQTVGLRSDC